MALSSARLALWHDLACAVLVCASFGTGLARAAPPCDAAPCAPVVLFSQGKGQSTIHSLQPGNGTPAGLNVNLWSTNGHKHLSPVEWNMSPYTGYKAPAGAMVEAIATNSGATGAQIAPDGSIFGVLIDTASWDTRGLGKQPLPFMAEWAPADVRPRPFAAGAQNFYVSWDMQIPTAPAGGCDRTGHSCAEAVLYVIMKEVVSRRSVAYGFNVFDTRGLSQAVIQSSIDNGPGGTGAIIVDSPAGSDTPYAVPSHSDAFQFKAWRGWKHFEFHFTTATFRSAIALANKRLGNRILSTNPTDYEVTDIQLDTEIEWRGGPNTKLGYSLRHFAAYYQ